LLVEESLPKSLERRISAAAALTAEPKAQVELPSRLPVQEKDMIEAALKETRGRVSGTAGVAVKSGIPRSTLESKIASLKI
jgi:DNA-binding NtrC family response regulator